MKKSSYNIFKPRRRGNSDTLCDEFKKGAEESGNTVEKLFLADKKSDIARVARLAAASANLARRKTTPRKS